MNAIPNPIYISGPMTDYPEWNYPAFNQLAAMLRSCGFIVINPAENFGGHSGRPRKDYMRQDVQHVLAARSLIVLPGWTESRGALLEVLVAREIGIPIFYWKDGAIKPLPEWISVRAKYEDCKDEEYREAKRNQEWAFCREGLREADFL